MTRDRYRNAAIKMAKRAGRLLRAEAGKGRQISFKGSPTNLVTEMDARAETLIIDAIRAEFPEHAILSEERGAVGGPSPHRWIVDPLDGTTNYAHGIPIFGVSVALETDGQTRLGVVYDPNLDECFVAERGKGASLNGQRLSVSATTTLNESLLATGLPYNVREAVRNNLAEFAAFSLRCQGVRRMGSAVLYFCYVAAGRLDGYWELRLGPWDAAAGTLMVEEARGRVTNLEGGPLDPEHPAVVASNGHIHDAMLRVLKEVQR
ncbi:MAG: inositol monophosphatase [Candidatus Rokubacteria bacterium]|nr:inositol monophosphatase [Candidatus Rokubacteria bacterium]